MDFKYWSVPCLDLYEVIFCKMQSPSDDLQSTDNAAETPCFEGQSGKICKTNPVVEVIVDISHFLLAINSSANVIIYALRGNLKLIGLNEFLDQNPA